MKLKYFGTDGVRGVANQDLSPELAFRVGRAGGYVLTRHSERKQPQVLVARDTRISGEMLENALIAGLLASIVKRKIHYPQISITVPSIVIMIPGLYMYQAMYNMGLASISVGALWITKALLIVVFLPLGLIAARIITDPKWRHNG